MRGDGGEEALLGGVADAEIVADFLDHLRQCRIMNVADAVEEVMFNLEIQPAQKPAEQPVAAGKIDGGQHLVDGPIGVHALAAVGCGNGFGEGGVFDTMGKLEDHAHDHAADERRRRRR